MLWSHQAYMYSASSQQQEVDWSFAGDQNSHSERNENWSSPLSLPFPARKWSSVWSLEAGMPKQTAANW